ncbi:PepSY domain-containing protein [Mesorhizobium muleiense]|uniref:PepSY domain-containing protein n=1 Tax=Mesorhizobium muleiense TaxID=1004279 RepID=UPI001F41F871|nr:PepSY domain-containing protein [Mesorhizobium muleiense]MCF6112168.1 PepSY domain-containing protein [Mesorhizobium muleiense]
MHKKPIVIAALVASTVASGGYAFADTDSHAADHAEMQAALAAKVSMMQAIQSAESQSGGRAMEAVFSDENGNPGYEVSIVTTDGAEHNLVVDASTGNVAKATQAAENENDDNGTVDEEGE